ncbi:MAG: GTP-binding protein, partial [Candidatus Binatia bacterium]
MPADDVSRIRSIATLGQGGVGKTTLADALLFAGGTVNRLGHVTEGSSNFDFEPEEHKHQVSISSAVHHVSWKKHEITIVDTPGYANFLADSRHALRAVDGGVLLIPGSAVKVETQRLWAWTEEEGIGCIGFLSNLDRESVEIDAVLERVGAALGTKLVALTLPIATAEGLSGYVDLVRERAFLFSGDQGQSREEGIPPDLVPAAQSARERLVETVAEASDDLLEKYLDAGKLDEEEIRTGLRRGTIGRKFVPVVCGSALRMIGVHAVLDAVLECLASPADRPPAKGVNPKT